jgi:hypothetical protein
MHIEGTIPTTVGEVRYAITDGKHVCISSSRCCVRNCYYDVALHLFLQPSNQWDTQEYGKPFDWHNPYVNRRTEQGGRNWDKQPSSSAKTALKTALMTAWMAFIPQHPELLKEAEKKDLDSKILGITEKIAGLEGQIEKLKAERTSLELRSA